MGEVLPHDALAELVRARQRRGERAIFTNGCFDLLHAGHIAYLQQARALGNLLIVGLNSDASTRRLKGPDRPLVPQAERVMVLAALSVVDYVTVFEDDTAEALVGALRPAVYAKGSDYAPARSGDAYHLRTEELRQVLQGATAAFPALEGLAARLPEAP